MKFNYLKNLVQEKIAGDSETTITEFKVNNADPQKIGEYISALSNSAAIANISQATMIWGIEDQSKKVVGTNFYPSSVKKGNEELENWLSRNLSPKVSFEFHDIDYEGKHLVILLIEKAAFQPIKFAGEEFIRMGSIKKKLKEHPEKEKQLWNIFSSVPFEYNCAKILEHKEMIFSLLDFESYYRLLGRSVPTNKDLIIEDFSGDGLINCTGGNWEITNLGALLFANHLSDFRPLARKAIRVILYKGKGKIETQKELQRNRGYASGFEGLIKYVNGLLPSNEVIRSALREEVPMYPELAIRELVANALIHQDFSISGTSPTIEIFENRVEITNPGLPLIHVERFLDAPPRSRNESLASLMRRMRICEERGSGIDKVVAVTEEYQLPAPKITVYDGHLKVTLFAQKNLNDMSKEEKIEATYMHACLKYVEQEHMSNQTLRERFGLTSKQNSVASRIIKDTLEEGRIKPLDPTTAPRYMKYIPYWA